MEWLIAHEDELNKNVTGSKSSAVSQPSDSNNAKASSTADVAAKTTNKEATNKSDDFRPEESAVEAAARKKITVEEAQRLITERAAIRAEEERKKEIEDEKKRRLDGQKMIQTRAELESLERVRLAKQIRQEKIELELHKKRVLEQIARDRENMKNKMSPAVEPARKATTATSSTSSNSSNTQAKLPSTECKIALRFPDGSSKVQKFSPQEQLAAVRLFVQMEKASASQNVEFVAPPNRKLTESNMNDTLDSLGLCPASRLEVKYSQPTWTDLD